MLRKKVQGRSAVLGSRYSFKSLVQVWPYPRFIFHIAPVALLYILANKADLHQKIILKNKNEGANLDEYQILFIYSCTVSEYKRKQL